MTSSKDNGVNAPTLSPALCKAARAILGWTQQDLADRAKVGSSTVADFERQKRTPVAANLQAIASALEESGIRFVAGGVQGPSANGKPQNNIVSGGAPIRLIDATDLSQWAARNDAKATFPELIERLILATTGGIPKRLQFRSGDSVQQAGWDGVCDQDATGHIEWLPMGISGWELGTQGSALATKADEDYAKRTRDSLGLPQKETTFIFATLRRWSKGGAHWSLEKRADQVWKDVRVLDADDLASWIALFPSVGYWLALRIGKFTPGVKPLEEFWREWRLSTEWPISTELLLAGRDRDAIELLKWLYGKPTVRAIQGDSAGEGGAFLYAAIDLLPEPYKTLYSSRCLFASSPETARGLGKSPSPLVIIMDDVEPGLAAHLVKQGHHVLTLYGSQVGTNDLVNILTRPPFEDFQEALQGMGIPEVKARSLARDSVRKLSILRRLIPSSAGAATPGWAQGDSGTLLVPALLAGAWDEAHEGDKAVLEMLSGAKFEAFMARCPGWIDFPDAPLRHAGTTWKVGSPYDAWFRLAGLIGKQDLETFAAAAREVLGAADPRFEMDPDERFYAPLRGKQPRYSPWLISGITETLLLLAMFGNQIRAVPNASQYADRIVHELLGQADERRWWSLSSELQTLAEISPDAFLNAIEESLAQSNRPIMVLFKEDKGPLMGHAYHSHLLWALETLAWSPNYLSRVTGILARLSILDPDGQWANRPKASLRSIFLLWLPQTNATFKQRFTVIDHLRRVEPVAAWKLMLAILPKGYDTGSHNSHPKWRDFEVDAPEEITNVMVFNGAKALIERLFEDAGADPERWAELIDHIAGFSPEWREQGWTRLGELADRLTDDITKLPIWTALRKLLSHHRSFPDAQWALPSAELDRIETIYRMFSPADLVIRCAWLFAHGPQSLKGIYIGDWERGEKENMEERKEAVREVNTQLGFEGIRRLISESKEPYLVGVAYSKAFPSNDALGATLSEFLREENPSTQSFVAGLIAAANDELGWKWSQGMLSQARSEGWDGGTITRFLLALPSNRTTWEEASSFGEVVRIAYWQKAYFFPRNESAEDKLYAIDQLLGAGRACEVVEIIAGAHVGIPASKIVDVLSEAASSSWPRDGNAAVMFQWGIGELLKALEADEAVEDSVVARLEWKYLAVLEHSQRTPIVLHRFMSADPDFFVQVLSAVFRPRSESAPKNHEPSDSERAMATQAFRLLHSWNAVPGGTDSGVDGPALMAWVREAHRLAVQAERGAIGDEYIGRILSFSPIGTDGTWPHEAVRGVIEEMRNSDLERGILIGIHNNQGVTSRGMFDGGTLERDVAKKYGAWSDSTKLEWPRTSALLREIARSFEHSARFHDEQAERTDWEY